MGYRFQRRVSSVVMTAHQQMSKRFAAAKWLWAVIVVLNVLLLVAPFASPAMSSGGTAIAIGLGVLVIPPMSFLLKWKADDYYSRGEELRRGIFLGDSVGRELSENDRLLIESESPLLPELEPRCIGPYYASSSAPGLRRIIENLHESSFYTRQLSKAAARIYAVVCLLGMSGVFLALWLNVETPFAAQGDWSAAERVARLVAEFFGFFAAGLFADMWLSYVSLAKSADAVFRNCHALKREETLDAATVYTEVANYDCGLARARPIPGWLKWLLGHRLAQAWAKCCGPPPAASGL